MVPLDGRVQAEGPDNLVVRARIEESGAGDGDQVGDVLRIDSRTGIQGFLGGLNEEVSMAAESKHVLTSRDPSRVRPGWAANTALASDWTRMVGGTAVSKDLR